MYRNINNTSSTLRYTGASRKLGDLLRELSDDSDEDDLMDVDNNVGSSLTVPSGASEPWLESFNGYLKSTDQLGKLTIVQWWGVSYF
jgi:hypothetical protein